MAIAEVVWNTVSTVPVSNKLGAEGGMVNEKDVVLVTSSRQLSEAFFGQDVQRPVGDDLRPLQQQQSRAQRNGLCDAVCHVEHRNRQRALDIAGIAVYNESGRPDLNQASGRPSPLYQDSPCCCARRSDDTDARREARRCFGRSDRRSQTRPESGQAVPCY